MSFFQNKRILKKGILGFVVLFFFLIPPFVSIRDNVQSQNSSVIVSVGGMFAEAQGVGAPPPDPSKVVKSDDDKLLNKALSYIGKFIGNIILNIASAFVWVGGQALETSVEKLIFGMGTYVHSNSLGESIDTLWRLIRDICNLAFIFGFIYTGIRLIIDSDSSSAKSFLSRIIIGALLINFSLFFVKFIVDASNYTAAQIYIEMGSDSHSIADRMANSLGISGAYKSPSPEVLEKLTENGVFWYYVMVSLLLFIAAFVFIAGAALIIVRFVALILIMIGSPVLFVATIFPQTEKYASELWHKLISYSLFAPVYLLLTLIALLILDSFKGSLVNSGDTLMSGLTNVNPGNATDQFTVILNFLVAIFFMIASLLIAKNLGVKGADSAISVGKDLRARGQRLVGGATVGMAARAGRVTVGQGAHRLSEANWIKETSSKKGLMGYAARGLRGTSRSVGSASFDARNVGGAGKALGVGEGKKGGYTKGLEEREKKEKEYARSLGHDENLYKNTKDAQEGLVKAAKDNLQQAEDALYAANVENRDELATLAKEYHDPLTSDDRKKELSTRMLAINADIQRVKEEHEKNSIKPAKEALAKAEATMKEELALVKSARQTEYAKTVRTGIVQVPKFLNYSNDHVADAIKKIAGTDVSDQEKLINEIKKLQGSGGGKDAGGSH